MKLLNFLLEKCHYVFIYSLVLLENKLLKALTIVNFAQILEEQAQPVFMFSNNKKQWGKEIN